MISVLAVETIDSTNLEARRLWQRGEWAHAPYAVVAAEQTGGLGRDGRRWESPRGGLWMTVAWPCQRLDLAGRGIALVVGLAARDSIQSMMGINCQIKWPNDLLIEGRKICGILCQAESGLTPHVVFLGIGVNANLRSEDLGPGLRTPAISLMEAAGKPLNLSALRDAILGELTNVLTRFDAEGLSPFVQRVNSHLAWRNQVVSLKNPGSLTETEGSLVGIDPEGQLLLETTTGRLALVSGELRLTRPGR
jgi:BirA family biotin operon repressor/biotin-[acetyl-CoA-carboxylase] ligase